MSELALLLSIDFRSWFWSTCIEQQTGPPAPAPTPLSRRLRAKQAIPSCPPPALPHSGNQAPIVEQLALIQSTCPPEPALPPPAAGIAVIETKNVTNFESHAEGLAHRPADLTFFQEHCGSTTTMNRFKRQFRSIHSKQLIFTGPDPNCVQPSLD